MLSSEEFSVICRGFQKVLQVTVKFNTESKLSCQPALLSCRALSSCGHCVAITWALFHFSIYCSFYSWIVSCLKIVRVGALVALVLFRVRSNGVTIHTGIKTDRILFLLLTVLEQTAYMSATSMPTLIQP